MSIFEDFVAAAGAAELCWEPVAAAEPDGAGVVAPGAWGWCTLLHIPAQSPMLQKVQNIH